jgi:hypothetical protein
MLTVYQGKPRKNVLVLTTLHPKIVIHKGEERLLDFTEFCNSMKYRVDIVDQMARKYSVKARLHRWPVCVFYNILDFAVTDAWVIYKMATGRKIQ